MQLQNPIYLFLIMEGLLVSILLVFVELLQTLPCSSERVLQSSRRGKVQFPRAVVIMDEKDPNKEITFYMETSPGRSSYDPDGSTSYYISKKGQSSPVKIDLDSIDANNGDIKTNELWYFGVHGWSGNYNFTPITPELVNEIQKDGKSNIILVDWEKGASNSYYPTAVLSAKLVGSKVADVINNLVKKGVAKKDKIYLIGFSLGGHVVGHIGKNLYSKFQWKPKKITCIDPAGPLYEDKPKDERVDSMDAEYVEIFHTSGGRLGLWKPVGHVDIYVNKGTTRQPGCGIFADLSGSCSHTFAKTVYGNYTRLRMKAYKCSSFENFTRGHCDDNIDTFCEVGYKYPHCKEGVYHLNTKSYFG